MLGTDAPALESIGFAAVVAEAAAPVAPGELAAASLVPDVSPPASRLVTGMTSTSIAVGDPWSSRVSVSRA